MILESKNTCLKDYGDVGNFNIKDFRSEIVPIEYLYHPKGVGPNEELVKKLIENLNKEPLINPLVTHQYFRNYRDKDANDNYYYDRRLTGKGYWGNKFQNIPYSDDPQYVVGYGNCRLGAAKEMGYTHISCVLLRDFDVENLHSMGKMMGRYKEFSLDV